MADEMVRGESVVRVGVQKHPAHKAFFPTIGCIGIGPDQLIALTHRI